MATTRAVTLPALVVYVVEVRSCRGCQSAPQSTWVSYEEAE